MAESPGCQHQPIARSRLCRFPSGRNAALLDSADCAQPPDRPRRVPCAVPAIFPHSVAFMNSVKLKLLVLMLLSWLTLNAREDGGFSLTEFMKATEWGKI